MDKKNNEFLNQMNEIRINKFLSDAGYCSRREADRLIEKGMVFVGKEKALPGQKITGDEKIFVDGKEIVKQEKKVLLLFNKPRGIVCSTKQQRQEITVIDYLKYPVRIYPVGRLDKESEGLLLLTNQGDLVNKIMRAGNYHEKEYQVVVDRKIDKGFIQKMSKGVPILDTVTRPCIVEKIGERSFRIILTQGLNRQIRRMCQYLGYEVEALKRVRIMNLSLEGIEQGKYREISKQEWIELESLIASSSNETIKGSGGNHGYKNPGNERAGRKAKAGRKGVLSGRQGDHEQSGVRQALRQTSNARRGNRDYSRG